MKNKRIKIKEKYVIKIENETSSSEEDISWQFELYKLCIYILFRLFGISESVSEEYENELLLLFGFSKDTLL